MKKNTLSDGTDSVAWCWHRCLSYAADATEEAAAETTESSRRSDRF